MDASKVIENLQLIPHPEGGFFREIFRTDSITTIYFLLQNDDFSGFHRLQSHEIWYFHSGVPLNIYVIEKNGKLKIHSLSSLPGGVFQLCIEPGQWFAAAIESQKGYSLVGCAVAPAFTFDCFEMAKKEELLLQYPEHKEIIEKFCRE